MRFAEKPALNFLETLMKHFLTQKRPARITMLRCLVLGILAFTSSLAAQTRPNVLFIMADDLRPELGCYGVKHVVTPNLDRLAAQGVRFERAYCQEAICMSSRFSMLSGCRPDTRGIWTNRDVRKQLADLPLLPEHFKNNGYRSIGMGKIAHGGWETPSCWSEPYFLPANIAYEYRTRAGRTLVKKLQDEAAAAGRPDPFLRVREEIRRGLPVESLDAEDNELGDGQLADKAIAVLSQVKDRPFFMGLGFLRPHLPFVAPKKYFDLYDPAKLPLAPADTLPTGMPALAVNHSGELRTQYREVPAKGPIPEPLARHLLHGYLACASYVDAQIGRVLDELDRLDLGKNTIVVFTSDHGFHLGDLGQWCKATNFEVAARVPLIIRAPGMKAQGAQSRALVELVGLYPTLCDLAQLPKPAHLEGASFAPLLDEPEKPLLDAALSQFPRNGAMGRSLRTDRHRYTEWADQKSSKIVARELYDHENDPHETVNLAGKPEMQSLMESLSRRLKEARGRNR